jgi:PAS domain S-box-containing protein
MSPAKRISDFIPNRKDLICQLEGSSISPVDPDWVSSLAGGGEMGARIRSFDWSATPLGPISAWPSSLREVLSSCLRSRFQLAIYWGPELVLLYNDAERDILGTMHPHALGRPASEVLAESWELLSPMLHGVLAGGEATWAVDQELRLNRRGVVETSFFTYSYSPIPDGNSIGGVLLVTFETTERVLAERRLGTLRQLAGESARARSADEACAVAAGVFQENRSDLPFSLIFLANGDGRFHLRASTGVASVPDADFWPLREVATTRQAQLIEGLALHIADAELNLSHKALVLPIAQAGKETSLGCLVVGLSSFRVFDEAYRGFLTLVAGQIATAVAGARAFEEERRRAEALAELDAAKTAFFTNVSHEFRTPLTLLLAPLEESLTQGGDLLAPADRERLTVAHRNGLRLLKLVNMLLEFSRIESGRAQAAREPTDLATFTAELASMFRSPVEQAGMRLIVDCPPMSRPAAVDRDMWEKIVLNLLSNAFKFTNEGEIEVTLRQVGQRAELSVRDTGAGIPEEELPRLFERFHQVRGVKGRSQEGTGIGLALIQELVRLHGGAINALSTYGRGSTFVVSLPMASVDLASGAGRVSSAPSPSATETYLAEVTRWLPEPAQQRSHQASTRPRVLVADDNADMRQYLRRLLAGAYQVEEASDGVAALAAARARPPDLVLADVMMPGLDGFGLLAALRSTLQAKAVPVILFSARAEEESRVEGLAAGADDYLVKPFSARELLARVRAHMEMARLRREWARRESELQAEARLAQEQAVAILESITDAFIALDSEWRYSHVNAEAERISGVRREDHIGKKLWEVFPAMRGTAMEGELRRAVVQQVPVQFENYYQPWDRWFHVKAYPSKDGGLSVFFHDITARKRSDDALRTAHGELERRVLERTQELFRANTRLGRQVAKRMRVEAARRKLLHRLVGAQEEERRRIARELHDDLTQQLAVLAIDAQRLEQAHGGVAEVGQRARAMREQLVVLSESLHSLSRQLHPSILDDLGLVDALGAECVSIRDRDDMTVSFLAYDVPASLSREVALCVYRVAQESLRNVARHARTRRASVRLFADEQDLVLRVRDRGVGFDVSTRGKTGIGLASMRERVRLVRGRLTVRSRLGKGTKVTLRVPLHWSPP